MPIGNTFHVLAFFAASSGIANENLVECSSTGCRVPRYVASMAPAREPAHLIDTYVKGPLRRDHLGNVTDAIRCVRRVSWAAQRIATTVLFSANILPSLLQLRAPSSQSLLFPTYFRPFQRCDHYSHPPFTVHTTSVHIFRLVNTFGELFHSPCGCRGNRASPPMQLRTPFIRAGNRS
jgi:hypothetical protein